jgi:hypothetical protein
MTDNERHLAHRHDGNALWQESLALYWFDERAGVGGGHRLAHEPVSGLANRHSGIVTSTGLRYRATDAALALGPSDRAPDRLAAGPQSVRLDEGGVVLELDEEECGYRLRFTDAYPMSPYPGAPDSVAETAPHHYEASGRVRGEVRIGDECYEVDGLCHRDHSWGQRRWDWVLDHRWIAGTLDTGVGFSIFTVHDREGGFVSGGFVAIDGEVLPASDVDVVASLESDGVTYRGGTVQATTAAGPLRLECRAVDGFVWGHRELAYTDTICTVRSDRGDGFCCFEVANNPRAGTAAPTLALRGCLVDGLSRR